MRREEHKRVPLSAVLYICSCMVMCVWVWVCVCGGSKALFSQSCDVCGQSRCSVAHGPLSALSQPMCYMAVCVSGVTEKTHRFLSVKDTPLPAVCH